MMSRRHPGSKIHRVARVLRRNRTPAEEALWNRLCERQLGFRFRRQFPIREFIVDFCCCEQRLVVELDGSQHGDDAHAVADGERTALLREHGYRVIRFWNEEVLTNLDGVVEKVLMELGQ